MIDAFGDMIWCGDRIKGEESGVNMEGPRNSTYYHPCFLSWDLNFLPDFFVRMRVGFKPSFVGSKLGVAEDLTSFGVFDIDVTVFLLARNEKTTADGKFIVRDNGGFVVEMMIGIKSIAETVSESVCTNTTSEARDRLTHRVDKVGTIAGDCDVRFVTAKASFRERWADITSKGSFWLVNRFDLV